MEIIGNINDPIDVQSGLNLHKGDENRAIFWSKIYVISLYQILSIYKKVSVAEQILGICEY